MSTSLTAQPPERRLSSADIFCTQTYETPDVEAQRIRGIASTLAVACLVLFMCLGVSVWRTHGIEQQRDVLAQELRTERTARIQASLAVKDVEMDAANYALDTRVRRDIVDERMSEQQQRAAELERLAQQVERDKLVEADCVTPRSILAAAGL